MMELAGYGFAVVLVSQLVVMSVCWLVRRPDCKDKKLYLPNHVVIGDRVIFWNQVTRVRLQSRPVAVWAFFVNDQQDRGWEFTGVEAEILSGWLKNHGCTI